MKAHKAEMQHTGTLHLSKITPYLCSQDTAQHSRLTPPYLPSSWLCFSFHISLSRDENSITFAVLWSCACYCFGPARFLRTAKMLFKRSLNMSCEELFEGASITPDCILYRFQGWALGTGCWAPTLNTELKMEIFCV